MLFFSYKLYHWIAVYIKMYTYLQRSQPLSTCQYFWLEVYRIFVHMKNVSLSLSQTRLLLVFFVNDLIDKSIILYRWLAPVSTGTNKIDCKYHTFTTPRHHPAFHGPLARNVILRVVHVPKMPGTFSPATDFKRNGVVSDPGMHHGTCVMHVPWCMSGSLTCSGRENVPGIPSACATRNFTYLPRGPSYEKTSVRLNEWMPYSIKLTM